MFYIEKNDKPSFIEKTFNLIEMRENVLYIPINENRKKEKYDNKMEIIARKTIKIIRKNSSSKKVVLSKELQKEKLYINYLNSYGIEISNGKWLYEILINEILEYIINNENIKKDTCRISMLINDLTDIEVENIKLLARKYKNINIVTNHIEKFKRLEEKLLNEEGIIITITNNKKRSLLKSQIVINVDFPQELLNKYLINDEAIIINVKEKPQINKKRFNGITINDYEINYREDKKNIMCLSNGFFLKDIYECQLYKKQNFNEIREKIRKDGVFITKLLLNNGEI